MFIEMDLSEKFGNITSVQTLLKICRAKGAKVYLVGGAVRDLLLKGELSQDLDFVVPASSAEEIAKAVSDELDGKCICLDEKYRIYRVILFPGLEMLDIAGCIGKDIHEDLLRRDLTINAMAYDFDTSEILDPTDGCKDLRQGIIRMVSEFNMTDDPLRMLRVFRIGAELGFQNIEEETLNSVKRHREKIVEAAPERIHYELMRMFSLQACFYHVRLMGETGLLEAVFPELSPMRQVPANFYHHLGLFDHTLELFNQIEIHFPDLPEDLREHLQAFLNPFTRRIATVRLAALFHDSGKPETMTYEEETGRYRFHGHDEASEKIAIVAGNRLKWGREITKAVANLVRWHLYPANMVKPELNQRVYRRFFSRMDKYLPEAILLSIADRFSAKGPLITQDELEFKKRGLLELWDLYQTFLVRDSSKPKLLTGREIMNVLNIEPGPRVGEILSELNEAFLNGEVSTKRDAVDWLNTRYRTAR